MRENTPETRSTIKSFETCRVQRGFERITIHSSVFVQGVGFVLRPCEATRLCSGFYQIVNFVDSPLCSIEIGMMGH